MSKVDAEGYLKAIRDLHERNGAEFHDVGRKTKDKGWYNDPLQALAAKCEVERYLQRIYTR